MVATGAGDQGGPGGQGRPACRIPGSTRDDGFAGGDGEGLAGRDPAGLGSKRSRPTTWFFPCPSLAIGAFRYVAVTFAAAIRSPFAGLMECDEGGGTDIPTDERTRAYVARRTKEGLSKKDITRCLKRFVAREVYRALTSTPTSRITQPDLAPAA